MDNSKSMVTQTALVKLNDSQHSKEKTYMEEEGALGELGEGSERERVMVVRMHHTDV